MSDIQTLMEVTGLPLEAAQRVLTVSNNNLERAINFHLEGGSIDDPVAAPAIVVPDEDGDSREGASSSASAAVDAGVDEDGVRAPIPVRREQMLQPEEDQFRMRVRRPFVTPFAAHNVCPLRNFQLEGERQEAQLTEAFRAVAGGGSGSGSGSGSGVGGSRVARSRASAVSANGEASAAAIPPRAAQSRADQMMAAIERELSGKRSRLGDLFRPPVDLSVMGSLQMVKDIAKRENRWMIVNLQDTSEFLSQVMNRDVWSDAGLRKVIGKYFVFWQITVDTSEGARFQSFYGARQLPYVCLIDPQTGEEKHNYKAAAAAAATAAAASTSAPPPPTAGSSRHGAASSRRNASVAIPFPLTASEFTADLMRFLRSQGCCPDPSARTSIAADDLSADDVAPLLDATATASASAPVVSLSEDEQLRLAIENSLRESKAAAAEAGAASGSGSRNRASTSSRSTSASPGEPPRKMARRSTATNATTSSDDDDDADADDDEDGGEVARVATSATTITKSMPSLADTEAPETEGGSVNWCPRPSEWQRYLGAASDALTKLQLRLPDGRRENLEWPCSTQLRALRLYVEHTYPEVTRLPYKLICPYPRKDVLELDAAETLLAAKLHPSVLLHVHQDD